MSEESKKESENANSNNIIKLIMVGDSGTGKTNLISVAAG
jgi:GTPase SAR1 family protein